MADNTSATGGYLRAQIVPDEGRDLTAFIGTVLAGLTGITLPGYIRPLWQAVPPTVPEPDQTWLAFGLQITEAAGIAPYVGFEEYTEGQTTLERVRMQQEETIEVNVQVYGLHCMAYAHAIRDGLNIGQNREAMKAEGLSYGGASQVRRVPELVDSRWYDRADITLTFRRQAERTYNILSLVQAVGEINEQPFETEIPS
jgi:hypothetical protein